MDSAPPPAPPPPVIVASSPVARTSAIIDRRAGVVRCGPKTVEPVSLQVPFPMPLPFGGGAALAMTKPKTIVFAIDATGRTYDIKAEDSGSTSAFGFDFDGGDAEAAIAATRFPANAPQRDCRTTVTATAVPVDKAPDELLYRLAASPTARGAGPDLRRRVMEISGECNRRPIQPRTVSYPDFTAAAPPHGGNYAYVYRFDITADGQTKDVKPLLPEATSDPAGAEIKRSLLASTFAPEARNGCIFITGRVGNPLEPPVRPDDRAFRVKGATCPFPASGKLSLSAVPFPEAFRRRNVFGWAVVRFDIAQWGQVGNVSAVAAQPAEAFGRQAVTLVKQARAATELAGKSGCIAFIRFQTSEDWSKSGVSGGAGPFIPDDRYED